VFISVLAAQAAQEKRVGAAVAGIVTRAGSEEPVANARVMLIPAAAAPSGVSLLRSNKSPSSNSFRSQYSSPALAAGSLRARSARPLASLDTSTDGRFAFTNVPPGSYRVAASADGYVPNEFGSTDVRGEGVAISLAAGQTLRDIAIPITPAGNLEGHIHEVSGEPIAGIPVYVCRFGYRADGKRYIEEIVGSTTTDDRGAYRIFWIAPGRYLVAAGGGGLIRFGLGSSRTAIFSGDAEDLASAQPIEILPGAEKALDFTLRPRDSFSIRTRIINSRTGQPPQYPDIDVSYVSPFGLSLSVAAQNYDPSTGLTEISDLIAGSYEIRLGGNPSLAGSRALFTTVELTDHDADGIVLDVADTLPGAFRPVRGKIRTLDGTLPTSANPIVVLTSSDGVEREFYPESDQTFEISLVRDPADENAAVNGREYRVAVTNLPKGWYVREARLDGVDALADPFRIGAGQQMELALSAKAADITGTVKTPEGKPAPGVAATLIPERARGRAELYRSELTDANGRFTFTDVPPGDYVAFGCVWKTLDSCAPFDPDVVRKFEGASVRIRVAESARQNLNLTLPPMVKPQ
jgi:hypothetical protein